MPGALFDSTDKNEKMTPESHLYRDAIRRLRVISVVVSNDDRKVLEHSFRVIIPFDRILKFLISGKIADPLNGSVVKDLRQLFRADQGVSGTVVIR